MRQYKTAFYKTDFYITGAEKRQRHTDPIKYTFTKVSGWGLIVQAPDGEYIEIRLDKRPTRWYVTERTTGLLLLPETFSNREQAQAALTPELLQKVADGLKQPDKIALANELADYILMGGQTER